MAKTPKPDVEAKRLKRCVRKLMKPFLKKGSR